MPVLMSLQYQWHFGGIGIQVPFLLLVFYITKHLLPFEIMHTVGSFHVKLTVLVLVNAFNRYQYLVLEYRG